MITRRFWRRFFTCSVALCCISLSGCNPLTALYFLFLMPPPKIPASCEALNEQTVVVMTYASHAAQYVHSSVEEDVLRGVLSQLRDNVDEIRIADPKDVSQWVDVHPDYELVDVGKEFAASRVVLIEIEEFGLHEKQSVQLYRGSAKVHIQVVDVEKDGEVIWQDYVEVEYPGSRPIPASEVSLDLFRLKFTQFLTRKISIRFFSYRPDENFTIN